MSRRCEIGIGANGLDAEYIYANNFGNDSIFSIKKIRHNRHKSK